MTSNFTSSPVTARCPPSLRLILLALDTEAWAVKLALRTSAWKLSSLAAESRFSISLSAGELTRVGTWPANVGARSPGHVRVVGEDAIDRDEDVAHVLERRAAGQQSREGGMPDHGLRREGEIIGRFKLHLGVVGVGRLADGRDLAVRVARGEGEGRRLAAGLQLLAVEAGTPGPAANLPGRGKRPLYEVAP